MAKAKLDFQELTPFWVHTKNEFLDKVHKKENLEKKSHGKNIFDYPEDDALLFSLPKADSGKKKKSSKFKLKKLEIPKSPLASQKSPVGSPKIIKPKRSGVFPRFNLSELRKIVIPQEWFRVNFLGEAIIEDDEVQSDDDDKIKPKTEVIGDSIKPIKEILKHYLFDKTIKIDDIGKKNDATELPELFDSDDDMDDVDYTSDIEDDYAEFLREAPILYETKDTCVSQLEIVDLYNPKRYQLDDIDPDAEK